MTELPKAFLTSESQEWETPWSVIEALKPEFNFVLDTCATYASSKAPMLYSKVSNAFAMDWARDAGVGCDVWCNPPYGDKEFPVKDWVFKACGYRHTINTCMLLPANKTDQDWFHHLVLRYGEYRPVRGRIDFIDSQTKKPAKGNSQGSMLVIFGPRYKPCIPKTFDYRAIRKRSK